MAEQRIDAQEMLAIEGDVKMWMFLLEAGDAEGAEQLCKDRVDRCDRVFGTSSLIYSAALSNLANVKESRGDWDAAAQLLARVLDICQPQLGLQHMKTSWYAQRLMECLRKRDQMQAAIAVYEKYLAWMAKCDKAALPPLQQMIFGRAEIKRMAGWPRPAVLRGSQVVCPDCGKQWGDVAKIKDNFRQRLQQSKESADHLLLPCPKCGKNIELAYP